MRTCLAIALVAVGLCGCGEMDDAFEPAPPATVVAFQVWNRTEELISLTDQVGRTMEVPACGWTSAAQFQLDHVTVRSARGYWFTFASGTPPGDVPRAQYLVLVAGRDVLPATTYDVPGELPACRGLPEVQPGV